MWPARNTTTPAAIIVLSALAVGAGGGRQAPDAPRLLDASVVGNRYYSAKSKGGTRELTISVVIREQGRELTEQSWEVAKLPGAAVMGEAQDITEMRWAKDVLNFTAVAPAKRYRCAVNGLAELQPRVECHAVAGAGGKAMAESVRKAGSYLKTKEPKVKWDERTGIAGYDVTWDEATDAVLLGKAGAGVAVGIVGASKHWVLRLDAEVLCGRPAEARLGFEDPRFPLEEIGCAGPALEEAECDEERRLQPALEKAAARGGKGLHVRVPDCDTVHLYFDGKTFKYWTH